MSSKLYNIKYIDLFAGIGGFHEAMKKADPTSKCIAAVEFDKASAEIYEKSHGIRPLGDITDNKVIEKIDRIIDKEGLDILFAGFPCQAFSKAGKQEGFQDQTRGTLFFSIKEILKKHKPKYFVLENVRNLVSHQKGGVKTMDVIEKVLKELGYSFTYSILSPHRIRDKNIPNMRERIFIYGILEEKNEEGRNIKEIKVNIESQFKKQSEVDFNFFKEINNYLIDSKPLEIPETKLKVLEIWEELNQKIISANGRLISPIWLDVMFNKNLQKSELEWKQKLINKNLQFFNEYKNIIKEWYKKHDKLSSYPPSFRKFEWNANHSINSIYEGIIQFRPSGIRVKKPDYFPTFVAINQTPIIGWEKRYPTPNEITKLFGFSNVKYDNGDSEAYKQLGNTVSVDVTKIVIENLLQWE